MNGENRPLGTDEPIEFEELWVEVQDVKKFTCRFRGIYRVCLKTVKIDRKITTRKLDWTWKHTGLNHQLKCRWNLMK